ncbi:MAG: 3-hydroxyacyl-CoA dehydrogenase [Acidobacteria bacterium]|nr:MAG: 3-hydroxyacyl-CoA dehydrogenase [Acidobacteriota bacterium]
MEIAGKTFLVSGGSSGLGAATARTLVASGANVVIADLARAPGERLAAELGPRARMLETDVADETSVQNAVDSALATFGGLHGAVNCAGVGTADRVLGKKGPHSLETFQKVVRVNLVGTFNVLRLAAAAIARTPADAAVTRGVIINTASIAAFDGQIGQAAYSASKGGIAAMTLPIARELARVGIRVVTIAPGIFDTPMLAGLPERIREELGRQIPFPSRLGRPEEYAALVRHIIENEMLNGEVIRLDGALRMPPK